MCLTDFSPLHSSVENPMVRPAQSQSSPPLLTIAAKLMRRVKKVLTGVLDRFDSQLLGALASSLYSVVLPKNSRTSFSRRVLDGAQPINPLRRKGIKPNIEVVVVAAEKDFDCLPLSIYSARQSVENPIDRVLVIVPSADLSAVKKLKLDAEIIAEEHWLPEKLMRAVDAHHPPGRRGWILQQVLGLWTILESPYAGVLILDADTVLLKPRTFLSEGGVQLLSFSHEYEITYEKHAERQWGTRRRKHGLSYVTHHQMVQPDILKKMFPTIAALEEWIRSASLETRSPVSEYHSYGRWLSDHFPQRVRFGRWRNKSLHRSQMEQEDPHSSLKELRSRFPRNLSVSLHTYLKAKEQEPSQD